MKIDRRESTRRKGPIRSGVERRKETEATDKAPVKRGSERRKVDRREKDRRKLPTVTIQEF